MTTYYCREKLNSHLPKKTKIVGPLKRGTYIVKCQFGNCQQINQIIVKRSLLNPEKPVLFSYKCSKCFIRNTLSVYDDGRLALILFA